MFVHLPGIRILFAHVLCPPCTIDQCNARWWAVSLCDVYNCGNAPIDWNDEVKREGGAALNGTAWVGAIWRDTQQPGIVFQPPQGLMQKLVRIQQRVE